MKEKKQKRRDIYVLQDMEMKEMNEIIEGIRNVGDREISMEVEKKRKWKKVNEEK